MERLWKAGGAWVPGGEPAAPGDQLSYCGADAAGDALCQFVEDATDALHADRGHRTVFVDEVRHYVESIQGLERLAQKVLESRPGDPTPL